MTEPDIRERLRALERAARPLDPGATRRRRLRADVVAATERFLRRIETVPAYLDTEDRGARLLRVHDVAETVQALALVAALLETD